jgi:hypothetical protein
VLVSERAEKAELVKTIGLMVPMMERMAARVDQIADAEKPARAIKNTAVYGLTKAQDGAPLGGQQQEKTLDEIVERLAKMTSRPNLELIK